MSFITRTSRALVALVRHEPVAVWGVVVAAALAALPALGVPTGVVTAVGAVVTLLGVPVVRGRVTPVAALKALLDGIDGKVDAKP